MYGRRRARPPWTIAQIRKHIECVYGKIKEENANCARNDYNPSVAFSFILEDGSEVVAHTSRSWKTVNFKHYKE